MGPLVPIGPIGLAESRALEVIALTNDLFVEFYCAGSAAICGTIFQNSKVRALVP